MNRKTISFDEFQERILRGKKRGLKLAAKILHAAATYNAPVGNPDNWKNPKAKPKGYVGGRLRNSISYSIGREKIEGGNSQGGAKVDTNAFVNVSADENVAKIGTSVDYARAVELGRPDVPNYPRKPFLKPAIDENKEVIKKAIADEIKKELFK